MALSIANKAQHLKANSETKSPILNQIFNNIQRFRQTQTRSPLNNHSKVAHKIQTKSRQPNKSSDKSSNLCRTLDNDFIKRQENLLLQVYASLETGKRIRNAGDARIDSEYERLQRKYCPKFKLANGTKQGFGEIKQSHNTKYETRKNNQKPILNQQRSRWNFQQNVKENKQNNCNNLKAPEKETVLKIENLKRELEINVTPNKQDDSDKTLTPGQESVIRINNIESGKNHIKMGDCPTADKHRVVASQANNISTTNVSTNKPNLKTSKALTKDHNSYTQLQQIFYHQAVPNAPTNSYNLKNKLDHLNLEIRQAIVMGKSADATINSLLANAIERALRENFSWSDIKSIINNLKNYNSKQKILHLLQIQLRQRVFILCTVRTCNFSHLLSLLDKIMHPVRAQFAPVLQHFSHCCVIEALVPRKYLQLNPKQFRQNLDCDAKVLKVKKIDVVDEVRGEVSVQCLPVSMPNTTKFMESLEYQVLTSDYGFRANREIILDTRTAAEYRKLINNLLQLPDIETISDNVIY